MTKGTSQQTATLVGGTCQQVCNLSIRLLAKGWGGSWPGVVSLSCLRVSGGQDVARGSWGWSFTPLALLG